VGQRRVFLTEVRDARGDAVTLTYDALFRLVAVTDALGQVSTLQYGAADDVRRLTGVTDPFGRTAAFSYTAAGQLAGITDVGGLTSSFAYAAEDFIAALTTPYGTTTFRHEGVDPDNHPWIEATDPLGGVQRAEYHWSTPAVPASVPAGEVPAGFAAWNTQLDHYVTLSWDARAWAAGPGSVATATVTRWFLQGWHGVFSRLQTTPVPQYVQRPGEARVWSAYPGQDRASVVIVGGWATTPSEVARVVEDGTTQRTRTTVNAQGQVVERTDPVGRRTSWTYAANGIDLLEVRQTTGGANDLLASYGSYTAGHQPQTITDAAGQTTTLTYTAAGQVATVTNARQETTTYAYNTGGQLTSVTGPVAGATTTYTYDGYGRVRTVTADGATVTTEYDAFDRPTAVWSADGTVERTTYDRLDVATQTDRLGRQTRYVHDAVRRRVATRDPAGRMIRQVYGPAGDQLIDANGHATRWERDVQGRVTRACHAEAREHGGRAKAGGARGRADGNRVHV
jgi:YD repeat-containing protein